MTSPERRVPGVATEGSRRRSWGTVTLAAMLVVASGLAVAAWGLHAGDKESVLTVRVAVAKGHVIERGDLASTAVAGVEGAVPVTRLDSVVGQTAAVDLVGGQVLTAAMFTSSPVPGEGQAVVGLSLDPTRVPATGLDSGDLVNVIAVPLAGDGAGSADDASLDSPYVLTSGAHVYSADGDPSTGSQLLVTLIVNADDAARLAAYSTQNRVALIETPATSSESDVQ